MLISNLIAIFAVGVAAAVASPLRSRTPYAVKEIHTVPHQWTRIATAPENHIIELQIGLKQSQFDELDRHLHEVSDPTHQRYGQHLTASEVNDLVKPTDETLDLVHEWLSENGIERTSISYSSAKDWLRVSLPTSTISNLLNTKFSIYTSSTGASIVRTPSWSLPLHLHTHIETIQPTTSFFHPRQMGRTLKKVPSSPVLPAAPPNTTGTALSVCKQELITPFCLRTLYGTIDYIPQSPGPNKIALNDFIGESSNRSDISLFLQKYRPDAISAAQTFKILTFANGSNSQGPSSPSELASGNDLEGNLDAETILGLSYPTPLTVFSTGGMPPFIVDANTQHDTNEPYLTWLQNVLLLSKDEMPQVISTSYADDEQSVPVAYARSVCRGFAQLGARGVTVLFASGDNGVGPAKTCVSNSNSSSNGDSIGDKPTFLPLFPPSCPYITSVGATKHIPEVAASDLSNAFYSGGGFSSYFSRPKYQDEVVIQYVEGLNGEFEGSYNSSGRAYPDLAAQGYHFATVWNGGPQTLDGTSAATPVVASIIALVNDALLAAKRPPMGFLNPWLYAGGWKTFTDVMNGSAVGCGTSGFPAKVGWDAVTGFGTPYFPAMKAAVLGDDCEE